MLFVLKNDQASIEVNSLGAELKSFKLKNEEYLYSGNDTHWHRSSPVLFPIIGKLKNNNYKYQNKNYSLPIHGLARHLEFILISQENNTLSFLLEENEESLKHYPFRFSLKISYVLNNNKLEIKYTIKSKDDILFSLGTHPAFLLKADINDSFIEFEKHENADLLSLNLENGCIKDKKKKDFLDSKFLNLEKNIFSKDALIFDNLKSKVIFLKNNKNNKKVSVEFKNFPFLGLWAPIGAAFVCLEPWCGIADYENSSYDLENKVGIITLKKNEVFNRKLLITIE